MLTEEAFSFIQTYMCASTTRCMKNEEINGKEMSGEPFSDVEQGLEGNTGGKLG